MFVQITFSIPFIDIYDCAFLGRVLLMSLLGNCFEWGGDSIHLREVGQSSPTQVERGICQYTNRAIVWKESIRHDGRHIDTNNTD